MNKANVIIAAVRNDEEFDKALLSDTSAIFLLYADILELEKCAKKAHDKSKKLFVHIDLTTGLGKDKSGIEFAKKAGIDGIISTKASLIKNAKESGLETVQRFFIVDSRSIDTTLETLKSAKPDMIEVMPGIAFKAIKMFADKLDIPVIAGGLINELDEVNTAVKHGAKSISTGNSDLWIQNVER